MKKIIFFFCILIIRLGYSQQWDWARKEGSVSADYAEDCVSDQSGNTFAIMVYSEDVVVNNIQFPSCTWPKSSLLIKYTNDGAVQWARRICVDYAKLALDNLGNCIVTAQVHNNALFENGIGGYDTIKSSDYSDASIAKYTSSGTLLWAQLYSKTDKKEFGQDIKADANNNIYLLSTSHAQFTNRINITKFDSNGTMLWDITSNWAPHGAYKFDIDQYANIYVVGGTESNTYFGNDTIHSSWMNPKFFICKIDSSGHVQWLKDKPGKASFTGIKVSSLGSLFVAGQVSVTDTANFEGELVTYRSFIAKYDTSMNFKWVRTFSGSSFTPLLDVDNNDGVYLSLSFPDSVVFYQDPVVIATQASSAFCLSKYNGNGDRQWSMKSDGSASSKSFVIGMSRDSSNNIFMVGKFQDSLNLGPIVLSDTCKHCDSDFFITKVSTNSLVNVQKRESSEYVSVFPNPSSGIVSVILLNARNARICVHDVLGNSVLNQDYCNETNLKIDMSKQAKGIYFMEILSYNKKVVKKIVLN